MFVRIIFFSSDGMNIFFKFLFLLNLFFLFIVKGVYASDWQHRIGVLAMITPDFQGATTYKMRAFPFLSSSYKSWDFSVYDGISYKHKWLFGETNYGVGIDFGRDLDNHPSLSGLGDISVSPRIYMQHELKWYYAFCKFAITAYTLEMEGSSDLTLSVGHGFYVPKPRLFGSLSVGMVMANQSYHTTIFGVPKGIFEPFFDSESGIVSRFLSLTCIKPLTPSITLVVPFTYSFFDAKLEESPFVISRYQRRVMMIVSVDL